MYSKSQLAYKWLKYISVAANSKGHGIHSPFVFELVSEVLDDTRAYYAYEKVEEIKKNLLANHQQIQLDDLGAGSSSAGTLKTISEIARTSVSDQRFGRLLFRLAHFYQAKHMIELGSSLGISTAYLASADPLSAVVTLEGSSGIAAFAKETFQQLHLKNIKAEIGNFDDRLSEVIAENPPSELVFIDGNHRKKPVLDYFNRFMKKISPSSLIIIHDIHWSREMEDAWEQIKQYPEVKMSIDIFSAGLVFFRPEFQVKQQFTIRF